MDNPAIRAPNESRRFGSWTERLSFAYHTRRVMRNSWVEVNTAVLSANIEALRSAINPSTEIIFVVKSDAYGHGLVPTAREAAKAGVRWFGVAHLFEALAVREALPDVDILVMGVVDPSEAQVIAENRLTPMVVGAEHALALAESARTASVTVRAHLKIDTGMGRLGALWTEAVDAFRTVRGVAGVELVGVCSHFAAVEPSAPDRAGQQVERFLAVSRELEVLHGGPLFKHISSSRAILFHPEWDLDAIRPGICLYGYGTADPNMRFHTRPFLHWKCRVMQVKKVPAGFPIGYYGTHVTDAPTRIAILSAGYADGYHRVLSNRGHVLIHGRRCPVLGRVSMNWITVDVGIDGAARQGDEAVLIGEQEGVAVWAGELAKLCRTIPYEILVGIDHLADRRYVPRPV